MRPALDVAAVAVVASVTSGALVGGLVLWPLAEMETAVCVSLHEAGRLLGVN